MMKIPDIIGNWSLKRLLTVEERQQLITAELADSSSSRAWGIDATNALEKIDRRWQLFCLVCPEVIEFCQNRGFQKQRILRELWRFWLPLAIQLAEIRANLGRTLIQGILGGQGTGKSTTAAITRIILNYLGYAAIDFSLDDIYLTYAERQQLHKADPRSIWRGPPGTHDIDLGLQVFDRCLKEDCSKPILIPRFDKSALNGAGDRTNPESISQVDIVLFEGWFVGVRPISDSAFDNPPPPILTPEDYIWARDNNEWLKGYLPLWDRLDSLIILNPMNYRLSQQWRKQAEQKAIAQGKSGMSDREIELFVEYFWKSLHPELFIPPLISNPDLCDLVIEIDAAHQTGKIYRSQDVGDVKNSS